MNSLAFRMKKNYRTYAMVTVLMICSVTVLAFSIAMKQRYEKIHAFDRVYTCQVVSTQPKDGKEIARGIQQENELECWNTYELVNSGIPKPCIQNTIKRCTVWYLIPR